MSKGTKTWNMVRVDGSDAYATTDIVAEEFPLTIMINGQEFATMVCTPDHLEELVIGFLATEGAIYTIKEIEQLSIDEERGFAYVETSRPIPVGESEQKRWIGSCCGKSRAFYFQNDAKTARTVMNQFTLSPESCMQLMESFHENAHTFQRTGGVHQAAIASDGEIEIQFSDIGRHNALDKLYGHVIKNGGRKKNHVIIFSGRISSEVLLKVSKMGIGCLLSKSAPTDLALQLAEDLNITAVGFIRGGRMNVYTHPERIELKRKGRYRHTEQGGIQLNDRDHTVVTINGTEYLADPGQNLLDLINTTDEDVPQICYNESLGPIQTCDTCMVQVNGEIQRACGMKVEAGMRVQTKLPHVHKAQKEALDRVLEKHELYCTVCDYNNGDCEIHNTMADFGLDHQSRPFQPTSYNRDDSGSFYRYDPDQCILCGRCVEVCQDVQVNETLTIDWERQEPRVIWDNDVPIDQSSCVNCGQCSTVCPCNAMMEVGMEKEAGFLTDQQPGILKSMIDLTKKVETGYGPLFAVSDSEAAMREERIDKTKTVCTYCGVGCSFDVWTKDREILKVEPHPESPANGISTCVKGKFGWDYVNSDDRLQKPLIRRGDTFEEVEWEEAIAYAVRRMNEIKAEKGADHLGFISSSKATNEESYLMQKISRQVIGTNNVDNCSRYCQAPATKGLFRTVGYGGDSGSIDDLAKSELVMTIGSNTAESHPVLASRIKRSQKLFGQKLFVFDLRKHEMAKRADRFFSPKSGTDLVWISAVTKYILDQGWEDQNFLNDWVNGFEDYRESLEPFTLEYAANMTGFSEEDLKDLAKEIVEAKTVSVCWAMGVTQHMLGSDTSTAISNLLLITGNYGKPGTGAYPLRGHNNVQGCSDFGSQPDQYPGYESVTDDEVRKRYEEAWGVDLPHEKGMDNHEMIEAIHDGNLSMMYVIGEDTGIVDANINYVTAAFEKLDFFIVQDLFLTRTAEYADVVLPASPSLEKEGTFTNTERRIQRLYQSLEPLQGTKPDWEILQDIAKEAGFDWNYKHPSEIMDEAASLAPLFAGVTYDRLEGYDSLQWPVAKDGTDEPLLFVDGFPFEDGKARLYPLDFELMYDTTEEYDLHVNNGRLLEHFHEGNMTYRSAGISRKTPDSFVEVSEELAKERGIEEGARVKLISESGEATGTVTVTDRVKGKELFVPMNGTGKSAVNLLTDNRVDKDTDTPAYKEIAVKMKVLKKKGKSPIPDNNHRRGNPVPQISVKVEEKWKRDDYEFPGSQVKR